MEPPEIDTALAVALVAEQFPRWAHLPVEPVVPGGHDNRTFRLGDELTIRLPTADGYVPGELKEHEWLPRLAPVLPLPIPEVVAEGAPSALFPRPWSVRRWIEGDTATPSRIEDPVGFARDLAAFLLALERADAVGGPAAGAQSFHRGADLVVYDPETRRAIETLADELGSERARAATAVWDAALESRWPHPPVWFHGDIAPGNLLVRDGRLAAVIDFGTSGVGDPACDLAIAWTTLRGEARETYLDALGRDEATVARGRGWALWKALITVVEHGAGGNAQAVEARATLDELL